METFLIFNNLNIGFAETLIIDLRSLRYIYSHRLAYLRPGSSKVTSNFSPQNLSLEIYSSFKQFVLKLGKGR